MCQIQKWETSFLPVSISWNPPSFMATVNCKRIWKIQFSCVPKKKKTEFGKPFLSATIMLFKRQLKISNSYTSGVIILLHIFIWNNHAWWLPVKVEYKARLQLACLPASHQCGFRFILRGGSERLIIESTPFCVTATIRLDLNL